MLVAQISDLHITLGDGPLAQMVDTSSTLRSVVATMNAMSARPDVILLTGDLTDNGTRDEYELLHDIVDPLEIPTLLLAGNHDDVPTLLDVFADSVASDLPTGHFSYVTDEFPVRLVGLDTTVPGAEHGLFDDLRAAWLDDVLCQGPDEPTLLFMHHPPFETGLRWMDLTTLKGADRFADVITAHPQVRLVVAGHVHRPIQTVIGGALVSICPSTAFQIGLQLDPNLAEVTDQPPSYQLHLWREDRFITHTAPVWEGQSADLSEYARQLEQAADQAG